MNTREKAALVVAGAVTAGVVGYSLPTPHDTPTPTPTPTHTTLGNLLKGMTTQPTPTPTSVEYLRTVYKVPDTLPTYKEGIRCIWIHNTQTRDIRWQKYLVPPEMRIKVCPGNFYTLPY